MFDKDTGRNRRIHGEQFDCQLTEEGKEKAVELYNILVDRSLLLAESDIKKRGFQPIGNGDSRVVLAPMSEELMTEPDCVVKIAMYGYTFQNKNEYHNWMEFDTDTRELFAPIIEHDPEYRWVTMPYGEGRPPENEAREILTSLHASPWTVPDVQLEDVMWIGDDKRIIDYGFRAEKQ